MRWCVAAKLVANPTTFLACLLDTGTSDIVELSMKDDFWGAIPTGNRLVGQNMLGKILTDLRDLVAGCELDDWQLAVKQQYPDTYSLLSRDVTLADVIPPRRTTLF